MLVFAPAHDFEKGVVASVKVVLLVVPGQGHPLVLMVDEELGIIPLMIIEFAAIGKSP
jgi:hypothetical protein